MVSVRSISCASNPGLTNKPRIYQDYDSGCPSAAGTRRRPLAEPEDLFLAEGAGNILTRSSIRGSLLRLSSGGFFSRESS
jgi:hypothetical protein